MRPIGHFAVSLIGAGIAHSLVGNFISTITFFITSIFIDIDHIFDFWRERGLRNLSIRNLFDYCYGNKSSKISIVFHSLDFLLVLWIFITVYKLNIFWIFFALGLSVHLIIDQLTNPAFVFTYFFTYRWMKHFKAEELFCEHKSKR